MLIFVFIIILTFATYVYVRWLQVKQYWAKRHVDHTSPNPLTGSMTFLMKENISIWFRRIYKEYKGPYVGIWIFWRPSLIVNSPEIARNILVREQGYFRNRFATSGTTDPVGRLNLFTLDDPLWTLIRRRLTYFFTSAKLRVVENLVIEKSKELIVRIEKERKTLKPIDLRNMFTDFSTDIIGTAAFGVVSDATLSGTSHIKRITESFMKFDVLRGLSWLSCFFIPELADFFRFKMFPAESTEYMKKIMREIIAQRGGLENNITEPRDFLDILIKIKQENNKELDMTENMMLAQAAVLLQAGFDTTATTLSFIIYELAFNPEVQEKLHKELQEAEHKYGSDLISSNVLSQLTYLNCVIKEALRKYPIISWLDRVALMDYKVDDHLTIKAGTPVSVNVIGMQYDPVIFPEPDSFNPDRFLPENNIDIRPFQYMPFGEGPRKCIGQRFGLSSMRHALTAVTLNFELMSLPNSPKPTSIKLEDISLLTVPGEILSVNFIPRKNV